MRPDGRALEDLSPREFENLGFDLMQAVGMTELVWRTPGPDAGRDIQGFFPVQDLSGYTDQQLWYVECKRYASSLDWPTVWKKIAYADSACADFLLIFTNSNPSPQCETEIINWNSTKKLPKVRIWRGYDLRRILVQYSAVAAKYGLAGSPEMEAAAFLALARETTKLIDAAYVGYQLGLNGAPALEAAAALGELLSLRIADIATYGRAVVIPPTFHAETYYDWLRLEGDVPWISDTALRAITSVLKYITASETIMARAVADSVIQLSAVAPRLSLNLAGLAILKELSIWTDTELEVLTHEPAAISMKRRQVE